MVKPPDVGRIQVEEDVQFLRREWRFQRVGWLVIALVLLAGLTGALGHGPLSSARTGDVRRFAIEYERLLRHGAQAQFRIHVGPQLQSDSIIRIAMPRDYAAELQLTFTAPQPMDQFGAGDQVIYQFRRVEPRRTLIIVGTVRPEGYGSQRGRIELPGTASLAINHFVLP